MTVDGEWTVARDGTAVTCREGMRNGVRRAEILTVDGPDPVAVVLSELAGWIVVAPIEIGEQLLRHGSQKVRHAHSMRRDLVDDPPPAEWAEPVLAVGLRLVACDRDAAELLPAWRAAFPPGHVDRFEGSDAQALSTRLGPLLAGEVLGPVLPSSALVVDVDDRVVAGIVVTDHRDGTPWVGDVFRHPDAQYAGLGALVLRRALARIADQGFGEIGLAVSEGNPARGLYDRLGFRTVAISLTVSVP